MADRIRRFARLAFKAVAAVTLLCCGVILLFQSMGAWNRWRYSVRSSTDGSPRAPEQFFLRTSGSDQDTGTAPEHAWKSIEALNKTSFVPGDSIWFEGGQRFAGNVVIGRDDRGTPDKPIHIGSFGMGQATIVASSGSAILIYDTGGVAVQNLKLSGERKAENGVMVYNDLLGGVKIPFIRIDSVEAFGFEKYGIGVGGNLWGSGFRDVRITRVSAHHNLLAGIEIYGAYSSLPVFRNNRPHRDIYIGDSEAHDNSGVEGPEKENSGSGIVVSAVNDGTIERSVAYHNGFKSNSKAGGPVGIWAWDADSITIQNNRAYDNRTSGPKDGGGFDLDGGTTHSIMQYNYSSGNDGAGYLVCSFAHWDSTSSNTVRYNISINDGRKNSYAAIYLFGSVADINLYNNTIVVDRAETGDPLALNVEGTTKAVHFRNNLFYAGKGLSILRVNSQQDGLVFQGNAYISEEEAPKFEWGDSTFDGLQQWRTATGQESLASVPTGVESHDALHNGSNDSQRSAEILSSLQTVKGEGLNIGAPFGVDNGGHDLCGTLLRPGSPSDIGAQEWRGGSKLTCLERPSEQK